MSAHTIAENLQRLIQAKEDIASAIEAKGVILTEDSGLEDYPTAISSISGGGGVTGPIGLTVNNVNISKIWPYNEWSYQQDTQDTARTTLTVGPITTYSQVTLMLIVMHRDDSVSLAGSGWTLLTKIGSSYSTYTQYISIYTKVVQAGSYSETITLANEARMTAKIVTLYNVSNISVVEGQVIPNIPYTPTAKTNKKRMYILSHIFANTDVTETFTASYQNLDLRLANEIRLQVFYDYEINISETPIFTTALTSYNENTSSIVVLDLIPER